MDVAASRVVHLALAHRDRSTVADALRRLGLPARRSVAAGPLSAGRRELDRRTVKRFASRCGPPASLLAAVDLIGRHLPLSSVRAAMLLYDAGLTVGVVTPATVRLLCLLWDLPAPGWRTVTRTGQHDRDGARPPGVMPLLVGPGWTDQRDGLAGFQAMAAHRGALPLTEAVGLLRGHPGWQAMSEAAVLDVFDAWALHVPGSPVVWDRGRVGTLARPVERALAACGPLSPEELHSGLLRASPAFSPAPTPSLGTVRAWVGEHPSVQVLANGRVEMTGYRAPAADALLTAADLVMVRHLRKAGAPVTGAVLRDRLVTAGVIGTAGAAAVTVHTAPFLTAVDRRLFTLLGGHGGL